MTTFTKLLAAASALALTCSICAPALADSTSTQAANQTINQSQYGLGNGPFGVNLSLFDFGNQASIDTNAFENASGNIGVNLSAGNGNQQANVALVDTNSPTYAFSGDYEQSVLGEGTIVSGAESSAITDHAFDYASGRIAVNAAAGVWNQQGNAAFIVADDTLGKDNVYMSQSDAFTGCLACGLNTPIVGDLGASISGHAFDHSSGAIAANVAAGDINHQLNTLTVAYGGSNENATLDQSAFGHLYLLAGLNGAQIEDNAFSHASGNIEANVAAGSSNEQMNYTHVQSCGCEGGKTTIGQSDDLSLEVISGGNFADLTGNAFQNASGQIGANVAGGDVNQQANSLSVFH
jgi:hypothetical protein